jgi:exosortase A-associated hydrolase 1
MMAEQAVQFSCEGESLLGILHPAASDSDIGVVIIVGGPQYRIGSHRQFVHLARSLARAGMPALRFDYRGMGDSSGVLPGFEHLGPDITAAIEALRRHAPGVRRVVLWGLCDAASAILLDGVHHPDVCAIVVANPWARTEAGQARTYLKHYYLRRLAAPEFWKKLFSGRLSLRRAAGGLAENMAATQRKSEDESESDIPYPDRMLEGLHRFAGPVLLILSSEDYTAREFEDYARRSKTGRKALKKNTLSLVRLPRTDHTFSGDEGRCRVAGETTRWLAALASSRLA